MRNHLLARAARLVWPLLVLAAAGDSVAAEPPKGYDKVLVTRGRYLAQTAGCNDCHTPGYIQSAGKVDEKLWLTGDGLGWRGPWGTTYPSNLRLYMANMTQAQWLATARSFKPRPPMPWFNVHAMSDTDLKALYQYTRSLGPAGQPAPAWVPPDKVPAGPYVQFP